MGRKSKFTQEEKLHWVQKYLSGENSGRQIAKLIHTNNNTFFRWVRNYQSLGIDGLLTNQENTKYEVSLKTAAVRDYIKGLGSLRDISKKYAIRSEGQLRQWILKYNGHDNLKTSESGGTTIMTKGRKTSYDERIEIVKYCIEHQNNYAQTAQKFQVSYQQVYSWLNKYEQKDVEALHDKRGRKKPESEMSEQEKLRAKNKLLEAQNHRQEMEIAFLKKIDEIERRRF